MKNARLFIEYLEYCYLGGPEALQLCQAWLKEFKRYYIERAIEKDSPFFRSLE